MGCRRLPLAVAIELIAKEVRHHDRSRSDIVHEPRQAGLIDLEEADRCGHVAGPAGAIHDRRGDPEDQVGAGLVGDGRMTLRLEDVAEQRGRGRLAVGPGDDDRSVGQRARELGQDLRVYPARDIARECGPTAAPQAAAQSRRQLARPEGSHPPRPQPGPHQAAPDTGRQTQAEYPSSRIAVSAASASSRPANTANSAAPVPLLVSAGTARRSRSMASSSAGNSRRLATSRSFPNKPAKSPSPLAGFSPCPLAGSSPSPLAGFSPSPLAGFSPSPLAGEGRGGGLLSLCGRSSDYSLPSWGGARGGAP